MKRKLLYILNLLIIFAMLLLLIYYIFISEERNYRHISKTIVILVVYILSICGMTRRRSVFDYKIYENKYKDIINNAFSNDRSNYRKLIRAIVLFNKNSYDKAIQILDKLFDNCISPDDYSAVLMFKALCFSEQLNYNQEIETYQELLKYDNSNSRAWSNLGHAYENNGNSQEALKAYQNAVLHDENNAYAYNNLAVYYIKKGFPQDALTYALRAIEINSKVYQALSAASLAYKMLGDGENAEKYCKMYGVNGGNIKDLRATLENVS